MTAALDPTGEEVMTIGAARELADGEVVLVGVGPPNAAANLARRLDAPDCVLVYESGAIGAQPVRLPLSIGDDDLAATALELVSVVEMFNFWIGGGRIDVGFLGAAQIDSHANLNTTAIGSYEQPKVRLPGAGGAPEIAACAKSVIVIVRHSPRTFVERVALISALGDRTERARLKLPGGGIRLVLSPLGVFDFDDAGDMRVRSLHEGVSLEDAQAATGFELVAPDEVPVTPPPTADELALLRERVDVHGTLAQS